jgi:hypothetical protein
VIGAINDHMTRRGDSGFEDEDEEDEVEDLQNKVFIVEFDGLTKAMARRRWQKKPWFQTLVNDVKQMKRLFKAKGANRHKGSFLSIGLFNMVLI